MNSEEILPQILDLLKSLAAARQAPAAPALGFGASPKARFIYANRQYSDCLWYFWNGGKNTHEPIEFPALTGYIDKLEIEKKEFRGRAEEKINLTVRADQKFIIQAGVETIFGKGLLHALSKLPADAYKNPITIAVEAGTSDEVLFCRLYNPVNGNSVPSNYAEDTDWAATIQRAMGKINHP